MTTDPPLPQLDDRRCTGCGDCVRVCPTDCLEPFGRTVWLPRPADCIGCGACGAVCPADAVTLPDHHQGFSGSTRVIPQK